MSEHLPKRDVAAQLRDLARTVREQKWLILLCLVTTTAVAVVFTALEQPLYQATAKILLQDDNLTQAVAGTGFGGADPHRRAVTDAQLVPLPAVAERVSRTVKGSLATAAVSTSLNGDSNVLSVIVTDPSPTRAATLANAFAKQYLSFRADTNRALVRSAIGKLSARLAQMSPRSPQARALSNQVRQLRILASLQTGDAQVVSVAQPAAAAISPRPARNVALGVVVGLLLGLALAVLRDRLDRRVKNEDELAELVPDVPIIASVPEPRRRGIARELTGEAFHTLNTNLRLLSSERPLRTLLITSAGPGDGKSTVALNLAVAGGSAGSPALILDADMRRPALSHSLHTDGRAGISQILAGTGAVETSVQQRSVDATVNGSGPTAALNGEVSIVPAGPKPPNPQLLLGDSPLTALLHAASSKGERVIVDGPPVGVFSDMLPVARKVDGVIVVVRLYHSRRDDVIRLSRDLRNREVRPVGLVVLGTTGELSRYNRYYGG
jgi:receptor protein-tyrosine kinase